MTDQKQPPKLQTTPPDHVVIDRPYTARDFFLLACRGDPANLAAALSTKPGENFLLTTNIALRFSRDDVLAMLHEGGMEVTFPAANDEEKAP